ncbi:hypothetical protein [Kaarinaea lacus]
MAKLPKNIDYKQNVSRTQGQILLTLGNRGESQLIARPAIHRQDFRLLTVSLNGYGLRLMEPFIFVLMEQSL